MTNVVVCLADELKAMIYSSIEMSAMNDNIKASIYQELEDLPGCEGEIPIDFDEAKPGGRKAPKKKRRMSAYNLFVSDCVKAEKATSFKEGGQRMKECDANWKKGGEKLKKEYQTKIEQIRSTEGAL